jgi:hypothetical protein
MMKMARHNKKRNAGLLYEFLVRKISRSFVDEDNQSAEIAKKLIQNYFQSGTELHREYRLVNALVNVPVGNDQIAAAVLEEARRASIKFDSKTLKIEKDNLIRDINHSFGQESVYAESVPRYKEYATASTLVKYWRNEKNLDISTVVKYEKSLIETLSREKEEVIEPQADSRVDNLVVKIAQEKLQKKYESKISTRQVELINSYAYESDFDKTRTIIEGVCTNVLGKLQKAAQSGILRDLKEQKMQKLNENVSTLMTSEISDVTVARTLELIHLDKELEEMQK